MTQADIQKSLRLIHWYESSARAFLERLQPERVADLDLDRDRLKKRIEKMDCDLAVCFLGNSGVGKSTLINAMVGGVESVVPFGGIGPLTAQAVIVQYRASKGFEVEYHKSDRLSQTIFALEQFFKAELGNSETAVARNTESEEHQPFDEDSEDDPVGIEQDRRSTFRKRAQLIVTGSQDQERGVGYLVDSLREAMGNTRVWGTTARTDDEQRITGVQRVLALAAKNLTYTSGSAVSEEAIKAELRDHATGYLAPLIKKLTVHWPSPLLKEAVTLIDLPGVGIERDLHSEITRDWIRNRANALVLVVDHRGMTSAVAESLRSSEFLNRLIYSSDEPQDDPVVIVAVTRIDDAADSKRTEDKTKSKAQHFVDASAEARDQIRRSMRQSLEAIWLVSGEKTEARQRVVHNLLETLQVHPVSAPQYRKFLGEDEDDQPFLKELSQSGVPQFVDSLAILARDRRNKALEKLRTQNDVFFDRVDTMLRLIQAQWAEEGRAEEEAQKLREDLDVFMRPLREEFLARQGAYGYFLKKAIPKRISDLVTGAKATSKQEIQGYLEKLGSYHWKTLQASVRKQGRQYGASSSVDLPKEFALRFEEPIAEVWGKIILNDIRSETRSYAKDLENMIEEIVDWALAQGARVQPKLVEAQRDAIRADARKLQNVGKEMVKEMRDLANAQLVRAIEGPIKRACDDFVRGNWDSGVGVKDRILRMYKLLPKKVTDAAEAPATGILQELFREVYKEIKDALDDHQNPLDSVSEAIVSSTQKYLERSDAQRRRRVLAELAEVNSKAPALVTRAVEV